jgi:hypothetical protein
VALKEAGHLSDACTIILPVNTAFAACLESHVELLRASFRVDALAGNTSTLQQHHPAVKADLLIPARAMLNT